MATLPENSLLGDDQSCFSFLDFCEEKGEQSDEPTDRIIIAPSLQENPQPNAEINTTMKETEDFFAADLITLSAQERLEALDDVHCVGEELQETPEKTHESLAEFHRLVHKKRNPIYEMALSLNRAYVEDPSFRLMFLRANSYDVEKSVNQMMNLLEQKALYFGDDKVAREITLDDLNEEDQRCLLSICHIQESQDPMGRVISYWFPKEVGNHSVKSMIKAQYYLAFNILLRIPGVQTKGLVSVQYDTITPGEQVPSLGMHFLLATMSFAGCLPFRYTSTHSCLEASGRSSALHSSFLGLLVHALPKHARARIRIHYASHMELQYELRGYGIPRDTFPVDMNGNIREEMKHRWFYDHLQKIQQEPPPAPPLVDNDAQQGSRVEEAAIATGGFSERDVLLGRGRLIQYHPGNVQFRKHLEAYINEYERANRTKRREIASDLVRDLRASSVRFLKLADDNAWIENDFDDSVNKVAQFFRTKRRSIRRASSV